MIEVKGSMWDADASHFCITTNSVVKYNGELVMGAGIALQAKLRFPELPILFAQHVKSRGNTPCAIRHSSGKYYVSFPTKHHWKDPSDITLIIKSAKLIAKHIPADAKVAMSRPGCGNGGLAWETVKAAICDILDDRFTVYHF